MAMELGSGDCAHGKPILWFGNSVMFVEPCTEGCVEHLRREHFDVTIAAHPLARVA